ncbi:MAG: transposase [Clostridia bacterium]|nr:transposase [Clostridia bacterium]
MDLHPDMRELRDLKELYVEFNDRNAGDLEQAAKELDELIVRYWTCGQQIFKEFALLLRKYRDPIINSFVMVQRIGPDGIYDSRLSNGPIESLNRKAKDLKRSGRGYRNFAHLRNRFLFSTRFDPALNGKEDKPVIYVSDDDE